MTNLRQKDVPVHSFIQQLHTTASYKFIVHFKDTREMAANEIPIPRDPTDDEALALFKAIEEKFPSQTLGDDKWYVLLVSIAMQLHSTPS